MRPYARHPTRNGGVFFCFLFFLGGWARRAQAQPIRESRWGEGGGWARRAQAQLQVVCDNMLP